MPFKSQAQRRKFAQLLVEGKISPQTFEEWNRETGSEKLPERVRSGEAGTGKSKLAGKGKPKRASGTRARARSKKTRKAR